MSENIQSISQGTYTIGSTSAINFEAGPGISISEPTAGTVRIGNDETVLWSGAGTSSIQTNESMRNFEKCQVYLAHSNYGPAQIFNVDFSTMNTTGYFAVTRPRGWGNLNVAYIQLSADDTHLETIRSKCVSIGSWTGTTTGMSVTLNESEDRNSIIKVVGVNRISGSNA